MSYRDLEIWKIARELTSEIHRMSLSKLPKFEMYEEGTQIRRSMKSVRSTIVEGYARRRYKQELIRYLVYAQASCDETADHLNILFESGSLTDETLYKELSSRVDLLGKKINAFTQAMEAGHRSEK